MQARLFQRRSVALVISVLGAMALAVSSLLVGADWLHHAMPSAGHLALFAVSALATGLGGHLDRARTPWFAWPAYGILMPSAILGLALGSVAIRRGRLPDDPHHLHVLVIALLLFACTLPAVLLARKRLRGPKGIDQKRPD